MSCSEQENRNALLPSLANRMEDTKNKSAVDLYKYKMLCTESNLVFLLPAVKVQCTHVPFSILLLSPAPYGGHTHQRGTSYNPGRVLSSPAPGGGDHGGNASPFP